MKVNPLKTIFIVQNFLGLLRRYQNVFRSSFIFDVCQKGNHEEKERKKEERGRNFFILLPIDLNSYLFRTCAESFLWRTPHYQIHFASFIVFACFDGSYHVYKILSRLKVHSRLSAIIEKNRLSVILWCNLLPGWFAFVFLLIVFFPNKNGHNEQPRKRIAVNMRWSSAKQSCARIFPRSNEYQRVKQCVQRTKPSYSKEQVEAK